MKLALFEKNARDMQFFGCAIGDIPVGHLYYGNTRQRMWGNAPGSKAELESFRACDQLLRGERVMASLNWIGGEKPFTRGDVNYMLQWLQEKIVPLRPHVAVRARFLAGMLRHNVDPFHPLVGGLPGRKLMKDLEEEVKRVVRFEQPAPPKINQAQQGGRGIEGGGRGGGRGNEGWRGGGRGNEGGRRGGGRGREGGRGGQN